MKLSPKRAENLSITALVLNLIFFLLALYLSYSNAVWAIGVVGWLYLGSLPIWLVLIIQFRQRRLAEMEKFEAQEYQRLRKEGRGASVFEGEIEREFMLQQRRLDWVEKWLLPYFAIMVSIYLIAISIWQWTLVGKVELTPAGDLAVPVGMALGKIVVSLAGMSIVSFLFACYTIGMSRQNEWRPLRSGGIFLIGGTISSIVVAVALAGTAFAYYRPLIVVGKVLVGFVMVLGLEMALLVTLDFFRPRIKGQYQQAAFESRLLGLLGEPGGFFRTASHALDYQFGFKVSETWFYRLLEKYIVTLVLIQVTVLYLATCIAIVPTGNQAVCERWGAPMNLEQPWGAGLHFKMPFPIDKVRTFPVSQIMTVDVGYERNPEKYDASGRPVHDTTPVLWTKDHWKAEYPFLVPAKKAGVEVGDMNAVNNLFDKLVVAVVFQYHIVDIKQYAYQSGSFIEADKVIRQLCERAVLQYCSQNDIEQILGPGRNQTAQMLKDNINSSLTTYGVGVDVNFVGIKSVHPPVKVAESFEKVVSALQQKQTQILRAQGYARQVLNDAEAQSSIAKTNALAYKQERQLLANAEAQRFASNIKAFEKGGNVYLQREYLSVLDEYLPKLRKYLIASDNVDSWVYEFDLKDNVKTDMFSSLGIEKQEKNN